MITPGYGFTIFLHIRQEAGQKALSLARRLEKSTIKLEAYHRHLHFTHKVLQNQWIPNSLKFKLWTLPGSGHCIRARISICRDQISKNLKLHHQRNKTRSVISD